ncbi:histidine phosphatase family protein [Pseudomonas mucidolens]|uniref:lipopolysaccharide core heptose(II)-phosphate phosphatase PmrG n=1 Tax=Pseudomonas mucidolens TaxID=46679 RepID=UPI001E2ECED8|nr:histidine phosphatase family protein [Pseudomonas mucidolens]
MIDAIQTYPGSYRRQAEMLKRLSLRFVAVFALCLLVTSAMLWPSSPQNLAVEHRLLTSGALAAWRSGRLIVLVRHAERCDRSDNPCLGPIDGLTRPGGASAAAVGSAFHALGMPHSDVFSSPATRTLQTSRLMFAKVHVLPDRQTLCGRAIVHDVYTHKLVGRNLLLVTHSGCISDLERALGYPHADNAEYGSSLFVELTAHGKLKVLGSVASQDWHLALEQLHAYAGTGITRNGLTDL